MRSKSDIKRANFDFSVRDILNNREKKLQEEQENKLKKEREMLYEEAYTTDGLYLYNKRKKEQLLERKMTYMNHFVEVALSEALSYVVNEALLLDTDEYAKLNENYRFEIDETVKGFVENNQITENFKNATLLELFNLIQKDLPSAELYLSEEQEHQYVKDLIVSTPKIKKGLEAMARDVRARVANIVAKDQEALAKETDDLDYINQKELNKAPVVQVVPEVDQGVTPLADPEDPNAVATEKVIQNTEQHEPVQESFLIKKKSNTLGIVEALALNEAKTMIEDGKEYNKNLALANTIKLITIFEAVDESGIVRFGPNEYNRIVSATGKNMNPVAKTDLPGEELKTAPITNTKPCHKDKVEPAEKIDLPKTKKEEKIDKEIEELPGIKDVYQNAFGNFDVSVSSSIDPLFKPYADWQKNIGTTEITDIPENSLNGKYTNHRGEVYTEKQLREYFEREGFDLDRVDFDLLYTSYNFVKH